VNRTILHVNIPSFSVELECIRFPRFRHRPVVIVSPLGERARVVSLSPAAAGCGIARGMAVHRARRLCRDLIVLPADEPYYIAGNMELTSVLMRISPVVQPYRFGRAHSDLTRITRTGARIRDLGWRALKEIQAQLGVRGTVGIGKNKLLSQIISKLAPSQEVSMIREGEEEKFLSPLWSNNLPSVTPEVWEELLELNLLRVGDIAQFSAAELITVFGKIGEQLHQHSHGIDNSLVVPPKRDPEICQGELLAPDTNDMSALEMKLLRLADRASLDLRDKNLGALRLSLEIDYVDGKNVKGYQILRSPLSLAQPIFDNARQVLYRLQKRRTNVRSLALSLAHFAKRNPQLDLFAKPDQARAEKLQTALEKIRERFGEEKVGYRRVRRV